MAVKRWAPDRAQFFDSAGDPLNGGKMYWYAAGSTTPQNTYSDSAGSSANTNPIILDSAGRPQVEIYLITGQSYKLVLKTSADVTVWTEDNIAGINDATLTLDEWVSGPAPTYVSATSFTVAGDQTSILTVGRRVKITDAGGTKYGTIKTSAYTTLTTVTLDSQDSDALASPTSALSYGLLNPANTSHPVFSDALAQIGGSSDRSKRIRFELDGLTTATTRVLTPPDQDITLNEGKQAADVASAGTINLDTAGADLVDVTGTTTITAITLSQGRERTVRFTGALTLTNGASLVLPGGANITTAAGDFAIFRGYASGVVRCVSYVKASGASVLTRDYQEFTASGTWNKPSGYSASALVLIEAWGGGASGGRNNDTSNPGSRAGGGGGGAYKARWMKLSDLGATETVTVGAGGAAVSTNANGNPGGNSSFGSHVTAYGGSAPTAGGGGTGGAGGAGGGWSQGGGTTTTNDDSALGGYGIASATAGISGTHGGIWLGGAGGASADPPGTAGNGGGAVFGGGGGGGGPGNDGGTFGTPGAGGTSQFGGNGGAGATGSGNGVAGAVPGGGGGGAQSGTSGAGGNGLVRVTVFP